MKARSVRNGLARHGFLLLASLLAVLPPVLVFFISFKTRREFAANPFGIPAQFDLANYVRILTDERMLLFTLNSVITTTITVAFVVFGSTLAGYALARLRFRGNNGLFILFIMTDAVPLIVLLIPLFIVVHNLGLSGTRFELILPYTAMSLGVAIILMRGFFRGISSELEDAAILDGCNTLQLLWYVLLPVIRQGAIVVAIFTFLMAWNEYFLAAVLLPSQDLFTLPAGLGAVFRGRYANNWPIISAAVVFSAVPACVVFFLAQDKIVEGWTKGR